MSDTPPIITERENGPLVVKGVTRMIGPDGAEIETKPVMALCRCGASQNKPFCDGSHKGIEFDSSRIDTTARDKVFTYEAEGRRVHYNKLLCSHAGECVAHSREMFDPTRRPWAMPENGSVEDLEAIVQACPSGALRISYGEEAPAHRFVDGVQVKVEKNGSYWVKDVALEEPRTATGSTEKKIVLCRCGLSGNKPYCDGTHHDAGWKE